MGISINGSTNQIDLGSSGTIANLAVGGVPDATIDQDAVADNAIGLAELAGIARGKLIYGDASGNPAVLAPGSANQVLTSDGTDVAWAAAAGGGKIVKVWHTDTGSGEGIGGVVNTTTYTKKGYIDITPTSASNKILIVAKYNAHFRNAQNNENGNHYYTKLMRTSAWDDTSSPQDGEVLLGGIWAKDTGMELVGGSAVHWWLDAPATTSNRRYAFYAKCNDTDWTLYLNYLSTNQNIFAFEIADIVDAPPD